MNKIPAVVGDDGALYLFDGHVEEVEEDDEDYVGGGYRIGARKRARVGGKEIDVWEIFTRAAGRQARAQDLVRPFRPPRRRSEKIKMGHDLWKWDPLGGAIVEKITSFTFGRGVQISATGDEEKVLRKFWKKNELGLASKTLSDEGTAHGEVFLKLHVHKEDVAGPGDRVAWRAGHVQVVPVDPLIVSGVEHDPLNIKDIQNYLIQYDASEVDEQGGGREKKKEERVPPLDKFDPDRHDAALVHLKFNAASNELFGLSDLTRLKEWLDNYQEFLRDGVVINKLYRSPCYDITIQDADDREVRRAARRYEDWQIGSNPVHNDKEKWDILEFSGANVSQEDSRRAILLIIAAGAGLPEYMLADGANANLASAKAQQLPAIKKFEDRQETWRQFWVKVFEFVLDVAKEVGGLSLAPETDFEGDPSWMVDAKFPPILMEQDKEIAEANRAAIEDGYMSPQTAAARAGLDYEQELSLMEQAAKDRELLNLRVEAFKQSEDFQRMRSELLGDGADRVPVPVPPDEEDEDEEDEQIREPVSVE